MTESFNQKVDGLILDWLTVRLTPHAACLDTLLRPVNICWCDTTVQAACADALHERRCMLSGIYTHTCSMSMQYLIVVHRDMLTDGAHQSSLLPVAICVDVFGQDHF